MLEGKNLLDLSEKEMRSIRGCKISMIFQEPMTSLDPMFTIGSEIMEVLKLHQGLKKEEALAKAIESLCTVKFPDPEKRIDDYPHELSGGMRQRVMIAMALSCNPALLIADEPTTALDVTIQAQILKLINELRKKFNTSVLLITHDLGVIAKTCDNVALMYAGYMVEYTDVHTFFHKPMHPYAQALLKSIPRIDVNTDRLKIIKGLVPNLLDLPTGCPFHPRCEYCFEPCKKQLPPLTQVDKNHSVRCFLVGGL
jgi:peptide/nickel transport system ATP-binding protein/oligopeptide transport system ATP-binding protein